MYSKSRVSYKLTSKDLLNRKSTPTDYVDMKVEKKGHHVHKFDNLEKMIITVVAVTKKTLSRKKKQSLT